MRLLDLTLASPAENLALDEALLEEAEEQATGDEFLRLWEPAERMVVVGRSSHVQQEVDLEACQERGIPVLRRSSGGAAIVTGPGCLMYALVLSYERRPELRAIDHAHQFVLDTLAQSLQALAPGASRQGTSDLALGGRKFSGNSVRCKRTHFLYHGTLLYNLPLELIGQCLAMPPRQPDYRGNRAHELFVTNLPAAPEALRAALVRAWRAESSAAWPCQRVQQLVREKYGQREWNFKV